MADGDDGNATMQDLETKAAAAMEAVPITLVGVIRVPVPWLVSGNSIMLRGGGGWGMEDYFIFAYYYSRDSLVQMVIAPYLILFAPVWKTVRYYTPGSTTPGYLPGSIFRRVLAICDDC